MCMNRKTTALFLGLFVASFVLAQDEPAPEPAPETPAAPAGGGGGGGGGRGGGGGNGPQSYDRVITKDAKTAKGIFTVHTIRDRYYYEIPKAELGKDFLWNSQIAKTGSGAGYSGEQVADHVIRWQLKGNRVLLMEVHAGLIADPKSPIARSVEA